MDALIIFAFMFVIVAAISIGGFILYRRGLRFAKGIERGIKMVPILINLPPSSEDAEVSGRDVRDVIQERVSQAEVLYNLIASTATKGFKSKFFGQRHIAFEIVAIDGVIKFYAAVPVALVSVIKQAILTAYPSANLEEVEDHNVFSSTGKITGTYGGEVKLKQPYSYPIATANQLKRDAMQAIIKSLTNLEQGDGASLQILLRPAKDGWAKASENLVKKKRDDKGKSSGISPKALLQAPFKVPEGGDKEESSGSKPLTSLEQSVLDAIEEKTKSAGYEVLIRVVSSSSNAAQAQAITNNIVSSFSLFDAPGLNGFKFEPAKNIEKFVTDFIFRFFPPEKRKMILNSVELASLFHLPDYQFSKTTQLQRQFSKQVEGPSRLSKEGVILGHNVYHGVKKEIRLNDDDRRRHVYIVGQTGTGKTVMLSNMMVQDMKAGKGFAFIDPHGDEAEKLLGMVPKERSEDVIYFDPGDMDNPMGLNLFEYHTEDQKDFLIQEAINMLYRLYDPQHTGIIGPRYEHLFRNAALTVMADPEGGTFVDIPKLFRDPQYVRQKLKHVKDQSVREFWQKEMPQSQRSNDFGEVISWFVSKFGAFLSNQMMRNTIGQNQSSFNLREIMDSNKILIANLSKGRLGELNSQLLGMIFVMKFQAAAMSRASIPEEQRRDFSLYVDEFQNFSTESFAFILSEARKYHLNLVVANQFIAQLSDEVRDAVFGNVGTVVSLRAGPADADFLVKQFSPAFNERDIVNLPNYNAAVRLMSGGLPTEPFNIATLPPLSTSNPDLAEALKRLSAIKYGRPREEVEKEIFDRMSTKQAPSPYESLSTSTSRGGQQPAQRTKQPSPSKGDSSFLDEWLDKRRQALKQQPGSSNAGKPTGTGTRGANTATGQSQPASPTDSNQAKYHESASYASAKSVAPPQSSGRTSATNDQTPQSQAAPAQESEPQVSPPKQPEPVASNEPAAPSGPDVSPPSKESPPQSIDKAPTANSQSQSPTPTTKEPKPSALPPKQPESVASKEPATTNSSNVPSPSQKTPPADTQATYQQPQIYRPHQTVQPAEDESTVKDQGKDAEDKQPEPKAAVDKTTQPTNANVQPEVQTENAAASSNRTETPASVGSEPANQQDTAVPPDNTPAKEGASETQPADKQSQDREAPKTQKSTTGSGEIYIDEEGNIHQR